MGKSRSKFPPLHIGDVVKVNNGVPPILRNLVGCKGRVISQATSNFYWVEFEGHNPVRLKPSELEKVN